MLDPVAIREAVILDEAPKQELDPSAEHIVKAAVTAPSGKVYTAQVHGDAIALAARAKEFKDFGLYSWNDLLNAVPATFNMVMNVIQKGYTTSTGRFVSREEGGKLAVAAGQIPRQALTASGDLHSGDMVTRGRLYKGEGYGLHESVCISESRDPEFGQWFGDKVRKAFRVSKVARLTIDAPEVGAGWLDGGCRILAHALKLVHPEGEILTIMYPHDSENHADHYGYELASGGVVDGLGYHPSRTEWMNKFIAVEAPERKGLVHVVAGEAPSDEIPTVPWVEKALAAVIQKYLSGERVRESVDPDYRMQHRPNSKGPPAYDLLATDLAPRDIYLHPEWYTGDPGSAGYKESVRALRSIKGKPDATVLVFRASPANKLNTGDWVSLSRAYSQQHGMADDPSDDVPVHEFTVKAKDVLWDGNTLEEFGYWGAPI